MNTLWFFVWAVWSLYGIYYARKHDGEEQPNIDWKKTTASKAINLFFILQIAEVIRL